MKNNQFKVKAEVWVYPGKAGWHFLTVPKKQSEEIQSLFGVLKRGWGSLPVKVTLGKTTWETSIFPHKKSRGYLLPLKAEIRKKEGVKEGASISILLEILATFD